MSASQPLVAQRFRRALHTYDAEAQAQGEIAATLAALLAGAGAPESFTRALEFGCGTGGLTRHLARSFGFATLHLNDLVPEAGEQAAQAVGIKSCLLLPGPIESLPLPEVLDLVASSSTIQWVNDPAALLARLSLALKPGGWLALSGFARGHFPELQACGIAPAAPGYRDAEEWPALLPPTLEVRVLESRAITLNFPDARALLRHLRLTGVNGRAAMRWSRRDFMQFESKLRRVSFRESCLSLTYRPVWLIATRRRA